MAKIKFQAKEGGGFTLIPPGTYDFLIAQVKTDHEESNEGDPQLKITFEVADGDFAGEDFPQWLTVSKKWGWQIRVLAEAAGLELESDGVADENGHIDFEVDPDDLIGCYVRANLTHWEKNDANKTIYHQLDKAKFAPSPLQNAAAGDDAPDEGGNEAPNADAPSTAGRRRRA